MFHPRIHMTRSLLTAVLMMTFLLFGCDEEEVVGISDRDVVMQYLQGAEVSRELFRTDSLITDDLYTVPSDAEAVYRDIVDSVVRLTILDPDPDSNVIGIFDPPHYQKRYTFAKVEDDFYIRTQRIVGEDTVEVADVRTLTRHGFLLKLGSDARPYLGWKLQGFNGAGPVRTEVKDVATGRVYRGDALAGSLVYFQRIVVTSNRIDTVADRSSVQYVQVDTLPPIDKGAAVVFSSLDADSVSQYQMMTAETDDGFQMRRMGRRADLRYQDTVVTPANHNRLWNIVFFQEVGEFSPAPGMVVHRLWCAPYLVSQ